MNYHDAWNNQRPFNDDMEPYNKGRQINDLFCQMDESFSWHNLKNNYKDYYNYIAFINYNLLM